jgi:hypothetical protein
VTRGRVNFARCSIATSNDVQKQRKNKNAIVVENAIDV